MRFVTLYRRQGSRPSPWKEMQKSKMAVWRGLTNTVKRREVKSKGEKERYKHLNTEFQRIARRDKKACLMIQQSHCWAYTLRKPEGKETCVPQYSSQHCL